MLVLYTPCTYRYIYVTLTLQQKGSYVEVSFNIVYPHAGPHPGEV